jgi:hypothetical protein
MLEVWGVGSPRGGGIALSARLAVKLTHIRVQSLAVSVKEFFSAFDKKNEEDLRAHTDQLKIMDKKIDQATQDGIKIGLCMCHDRDAELRDATELRMAASRTEGHMEGRAEKEGKLQADVDNAKGRGVQEGWDAGFASGFAVAKLEETLQNNVAEEVGPILMNSVDQ